MAVSEAGYLPGAEQCDKRIVSPVEITAEHHSGSRFDRLNVRQAQRPFSKKQLSQPFICVGVTIPQNW